MAADKKNKPRVSDAKPSRGETDKNAVTQVGQVIQDLGKLTERLPTPPARKPRSGSRGSPAPSREQLVALIDALGDPQHPDHTNAIDELVKIGTPAIPFLTEALNPQRPWLMAYRAAETLGRIGSGRATGALIQALQHPNSNVRWSAVHALSQIGDLRALIELRRVAHDDQGKTSWGESVAESAQSALDRMRSQSVWGQSLELIKTAITSVLMILALILAFSVITTLRSELELIETAAPVEVGVAAANVRTPLPTPSVEQQPAAGVEPTVAATNSPTPAPAEELTGTVLQAANVRPFPSVNNQPIGSLRQNDQIIFLARTPDSQWYLIRVGPRAADSSVINNPDGSDTGWVNRALLSPPQGDVPVQESVLPTPTLEP